jgi:hypothetical protein
MNDPRYGNPGFGGQPQPMQPQPQMQPAQQWGPPPQVQPQQWGPPQGQPMQYQPQPMQFQPQPMQFQPQPQMQPQMAPQQPTGLPAYYIPDEQTVMEGYRVANEQLNRSGSGGKQGNFLKFPGPRGETKWNMVHVGYSSDLPVYILPAPQPQPGQQPTGFYLEVSTHFWKSQAHPQGAAIGCPGQDKCLVCQARKIGLGHPDPNVQKRAKEFGRTRTQYYYQVVMLQYPQMHVGEDGVMRPQILPAGKKLHTAIGRLLAERGIASIIDPMNGRPLKLTKKKTGPEDRDVEYAVLDMNPQPLPQQFYPCLHNLFNLQDFSKMPTQEEMLQAVQEMGLSMMESAAYNPYPSAPAWGNPYAQQPQGGFQQFAPQQQQQFGGFPVSQPMAPQQPQYPAPQQFAGFTQPMAPPPPPVVSTPQVNLNYPFTAEGGLTSQYPPMQTMQTQQMAPPPVEQYNFVPPQQMTPPPVSSNPAMASSYQPQPGNPGQIVPPPPMTPMSAPVVASGADTPHQITLPVPANSLPAGRDRCFGKMNMSDQYCQNCPDWIKSQCVGATRGSPPTGEAGAMIVPVDAQLQALQSQMVGK